MQTHDPEMLAVRALSARVLASRVAHTARSTPQVSLSATVHAMAQMGVASGHATGRAAPLSAAGGRLALGTAGSELSGVQHACRAGVVMGMGFGGAASAGARSIWTAGGEVLP